MDFKNIYFVLFMSEYFTNIMMINDCDIYI